MSLATEVSLLLMPSKNSYAPGIAGGIGAVGEIHAMLAEIFPPFGFIPFELDGPCSYVLELHQVVGRSRKCRLYEVPRHQFAGNGATGLSKIGAVFCFDLPSMQCEGLRGGLSAAHIDTGQRDHAGMDHSKAEGVVS